MPVITIAFEHPQATPPKFTFKERIAVVAQCHPSEWMAGTVIGLSLETDGDDTNWWVAVEIDYPQGLVENFIERELIQLSKLQVLQALWEQNKNNLVNFELESLLAHP